MHILLCPDNNYTMPTGILMHSIGINNHSEVYYHIMINSDYTDRNKHILERIAAQYGSGVSFYTIDKSVLSNFPFGRDFQPKGVSIDTYSRLLLTEVLPPEIHKILYLDGDMIVRKPLDGIWHTVLDGYALGCVHDMDEKVHILSNRLPYPMQYGYFNAGTLLINVDYWRENNCIMKFFDFACDNESVIKLHDQDILNSVFFNCKKWLPVTYNYQNGFLFSKEYRNSIEEIEQELAEVKSDPVIIHYSAASKPWRLSCNHPYRNEWRKYKRVSRWVFAPLKRDENDTFKNRILCYLIRWNIWEPKSYYNVEDIIPTHTISLLRLFHKR